MQGMQSNKQIATKTDVYLDKNEVFTVKRLKFKECHNRMKELSAIESTVSGKGFSTKKSIISTL